jgi:cytoskeletal protein RodZ
MGDTNKMLTAGRVLKARRKELGKSIEEIAAETKIQKKYIELIENDSEKEISDPVFIEGFVKIYAKHLLLDEDKILALFRRQTKNPSRKGIDTGTAISPKEKSFNITDLINPNSLIIIVISLILLGLFSYIAIQFYNFQKEPVISITNPDQQSIEISEPTITISGETEKDTTVTVNEDKATVKDDNTFEYPYSLKEGNNTIIIKSVRNNNSDSEATRVIEVKYTPEEEEEEEEEITQQDPEPEEVQKITLKIEVTDQSSWVQIVVDGEQKHAEVLQPNFSEEYNVNESLTVITGKPNSTVVYINGEKRNLPVDPEQGTAILDCQVEDNNIQCEQ